MNIRAKLTLLGLTAFAGLTLVAGIAFFEIHTLSERITDLSDDALPSIVSISHMNASLGLMRANASLNAISSDLKVLADSQGLYKNASENFSKEIAHYRKDLAYDTNDKKIIEELESSYQKLKAYLDRSVDFGRQGDKGSAQKMLTDGLPDALTARSTLDELTKFNIALGSRFAQEGKAAEQAAYLLCSTSFAIVTLIVGLFVFFIGKAISSPATRLRSGADKASTHKDLGVDFGPPGDDEIGDAVKSISIFFENISDSLDAIKLASIDVVSSTASLSQIANESSASADDQRQAASAMAAGVEELSSSIATVAHQAAQAKAIAESSDSLARRGASEITELLATIQQHEAATRQTASNIAALEQSASNISSVTNAIASIASQTNLLALNAAIEAARAGESGRGFAVVADEVRKLAEQTSSATTQIAATIDSMAKMTKAASEQARSLSDKSVQDTAQVEAFRKTIEEISSSFANVHGLSDQISQAMDEQNQGAILVAGKVEAVATGASIAYQTSEKTASASRELTRIAQKVSDLISVYKTR